MRTSSLTSSIRRLLFAGLVFAVPALAAEPAPVIVKLASLSAMPEAVQKTVRTELAGGTIRGLAKETDAEGKVTYEVEMRIKGLNKDVSLGEDGTVLVSEQQMSLAELPSPVRETVLKSAGKRKIRLIESVTKLGKLEYYEAHVATGKTLTEIVVGPDGKVIP